MKKVDYSPGALLRRYTRNEYPPALDEIAQSALKNYFRDRDLIERAGAAGPLSIKLLAGQAMSGLLLPYDYSDSRAREMSIIGPDFIGDEYIQNGVGIWMPAVLPRTPET